IRRHTAHLDRRRLRRDDDPLHGGDAEDVAAEDPTRRLVPKLGASSATSTSRPRLAPRAARGGIIMNDPGKVPTAGQKRWSDLWEEHVRYEFTTRNTDDTLATMVDDAYVNHVPVLTGGVGREQLREFYAT